VAAKIGIFFYSGNCRVIICDFLFFGQRLQQGV